MAQTFKELWAEIETAAVTAVASVKNEIVSLEEQIVPTIEADLVMLLDQLKDLAISTVLEVSQRALSGEEKFGTVVTTVLQSAEAQAIQIGIADAQMLAQQAYRAVQKAVGATS